MPVKKEMAAGPIKDMATAGSSLNKIKIIFDCSYHLTIREKIHHGIYKKGDVLTVDPELKVPFEKYKISPFIEGQIINNKQGEYVDGSN